MAKTADGSKMDAMIKGVLVVFVALLFFSVGTFVGKQVSDSDHKRMALEEEYAADRKVASEHPSEEDVKGENYEKVSEEELANLTEEFVAAEKKPDEQGHDEHADEASAPEPNDKTPEPSESHHSGYQKYGAAADKPIHKEEPKPEAENDHKPMPNPTPTDKERSPTAARIADGKAPSADPKTERKPDSVLPSVASSAVGKYTVQVASYGSEQEAKDHAAALRAKGWSSFYLTADVNGNTWYRVSVGLFSTLKSASEFKDQLIKEAKISTAIVQKIVK